MGSSVSKPVFNPWKQECQIENEPYLALHYPDKDRWEKFIQIFELSGAEGTRVEQIDGKVSPEREYRLSE